MTKRSSNCALLLGIVVVFSVFTTNSIFAKPTDIDLFELPLEQLIDIIVVTPSKKSESSRDAPAIISTVSATEIRRFGANNLLEILERMPSILAVSSVIFPQNTFSIRGDLPSHISTHVLILVNGRPFRETNLGGQNANILTAFPINAIDRIELVRGPGSVLYGTNAFTGVVNIITKSGPDGTATLSAGGGSLATRKFSYSSNGHIGDLKMSANVRRFKEDGWGFKAYLAPTAERELKFGEDQLSAILNFDYGELSIQSYLGRVKFDHFQPISPFASSTYDSGRILVDIEHKQNVGSSWLVRSNLTYNRTHDTLDDINLGLLTLQSDDTLVEINGFYRSSNKLELLLGALVNNVKGRRTSGGVTDLGPYDRDWYSAYMQADYHPTKIVNYILGGQYNKVPKTDWDFVPRLGIIVDFTKKLGLKFLYGKAFRSAFASETDLNLAPFLVGEPDLQPEKVTTYDLQLFYTTAEAEFAITYFESNQNNLITRAPNPDPQSFLIYTNQGKMQSEGLEFEGKIVLSKTLFANGSYSYQTNTDGTNNDVSLMPNRIAKLGVSYKFNTNYVLGVFDTYIGSAHSRSGTVKLNPDLSSYHALSANLNVNLARLLEWSSLRSIDLDLYGTNLLDQDIYYPEVVGGQLNANTVPGRAGRSIFVTLNSSF